MTMFRPLEEREIQRVTAARAAAVSGHTIEGGAALPVLLLWPCD